MVQCWFWVTVVGLANDDEEERGDGNSGMGEEDEDDGVFVQLTPPQTDDPAAASRKRCTWPGLANSVRPKQPYMIS